MINSDNAIKGGQSISSSNALRGASTIPHHRFRRYSPRAHNIPCRKCSSLINACPCNNCPLIIVASNPVSSSSGYVCFMLPTPVTKIATHWLKFQRALKGNHASTTKMNSWSYSNKPIFFHVPNDRSRPVQTYHSQHP